MLLLSAADIDRLVTIGDAIEAVESAFRARGLGSVQPGGVLGVHLTAGGFHLKAAASGPDGGYFAAKLNGNYPGNPERGLPTIQGLLLLAEVATGSPLAIMDSGAITILRTAAATGVAARFLALPHADTATIIGCGAQALAQLAAVHHVRPLVRATVYDARPAAALSLAARASRWLGIPVAAADDLQHACRDSDVIVTCTTAHRPFLGTDCVRAGALVAAVGADAASKSELEPSLLAAGAIVTDVTAQCAAFGDLHHALLAGAVRESDVRAELGQVVAGRRTGRAGPAERVVFDSTGAPIEDVAAAALVYERARSAAAGQVFVFRS